MLAVMTEIVVAVRKGALEVDAFGLRLGLGMTGMTGMTFMDPGKQTVVVSYGSVGEPDP